MTPFLRSAGLALLRRGAQAVFVSVLVGSLCFLLLRLLPGDMAMRIAAGRYGYDIVGGAAAASVRAELGLDRPALAQFAAWLGGIARGEFGRSLISGEPVVAAVMDDLGASLVLAAASLLVAVLLGPPLGVLAGLRPGGLLDTVLVAAAAALRATPSFLLGMVLLILFSARLGWLPAADDGSLAALLLPAGTLGLVLAATTARVTRDAAAAQAAPHVAFGRLKGLGPRRNVIRHVLRNASVPVSAYLGVQLVLLAEGVVAIEILFSRPGIGHALVHGVLGRDVPMVQGAALAMALAFVALNAGADLLVLALDPRRRA